MLTYEQQAVLDVIQSHRDAHAGHMPTYRQIAKAMVWNSPSTAFYVVQRLIERGHLVRVGRHYDIARPLVAVRGFVFVFNDERKELEPYRVEQ